MSKREAILRVKLRMARGGEHTMKQNIIIVAVVTLLIGGGAGFFGGVAFQKNQRPQFTQSGNGNFGGRTGNGTANGANRVRNGGGAVAGEIIASDASSITVKIADGSSKIVLMTGTTNINKATEGAKSDLTVGARVAIFGTTNTDGSVTAQNIQLNPTMRGPNGPSGGGTPGQ
jgi:Domain of unknown function (DUF5666)